MAQPGLARAMTCAAVGAALSWPASVAAADPLPTSSWAPAAVRLQADPAVAQVSGRYRCTGGSPTKDLWVSVKQGPGPAGLETGVEEPAAWYDLRDDERKAGLPAVCDGAWHPSRAVVESRLGSLRPGTAIVQWCLADRSPYELNSEGFAFGCQAATVVAR